MGGWVDHLGAIVFRAGVAVALVSSLVVLAMLGCRQPARRIALARSALLGVLLLIPLVGLAPLPSFHVLAALRRVGVLPHPLLAPLPLPLPWPAWALSATGPLGRWPARVLFGFYLAGVGTGLAGLLIGCWGVGWLTRNASAPSPRAQALYDTIPYSGRHSRPRLRVAARVHRPVLLGTFRPTILIPPGPLAEARDADARESLRLSLLHELAHAERLDPWFSLLGSLAQAFWFFLPPLWWIRARMYLDHEFLADRHAAHGFGAPATYASALVALAASNPDQPPSPTGTGTDTDTGTGTDTDTATPTVPPCRPPHPDAAAGSPLFQRILMLLACPFRVESHPPAWWRWSLPVLSLLIIPGSACLCLDLDAGAGAEAPSAARGVLPSRPHSFRVARLAVPPQGPGRHAHAPAFELPLPLPVEFDLELEIWGDPGTLARTRVLGQRLVPAPPPPHTGSRDDPRPEPEAWHRVQLRRSPAGLSVTLDGQPVPTDPIAAPLTPQLSVEPPPDSPCQLRNLVIAW